MLRRRRIVAAVLATAVVVVAVVVAVALVGSLVNALGGRSPRDDARRPAVTTGSPGTSSAPPASASAPTSATRSPAPSRTPSRAATATVVPTSGSGRLVPVPGEVPAPGRGPVTAVRVEVEAGVDVDPQAFAAEVMATLNDDRSWGHGGTRTFARTDGDADVVVVLGSPDTSAALCRPLRTFGRLSCRSGQRAVLTSYRWLGGQEEFPSLALYRQYVVNHEVGHVLGHGHEQCPGAGRLAPVMQQQTKQVAPCRANAWPYP